MSTGTLNMADLHLSRKNGTGSNWLDGGWVNFRPDTVDYSVGINQISSVIPERFSLSQNYPNPFNPSTKIKFDIPAANGNSNVKLLVFDAAGREVSTLINNQLSPGSYEMEFSAKNLTSGLYFYRLETDNFVDTKKMILVK